MAASVRLLLVAGQFDRVRLQRVQLSDSFELVRPLGRGAFGTTYLARERDGDRMVAVKHIAVRGLPEWKPLELLEREAKVLRNLSHPGVPAFIDAFEVDEVDSGPGFAIVTEYIEGTTLQEEIDRGRRFDASGARALLRDLLLTLVYLHSLAPPVIHRDIKPANVILRPDGSAVIVDFGSVRDALRAASGDAPTVAGTPGYMAPEQAFGQADARADLHGLGATLVHALTHTPPDELPRDGLRPRLDGLVDDTEIATILSRMLEPEPQRRWRSAVDVLEELEARALVLADAASLPAVPRVIDERTGALLDRREPPMVSQTNGVAVLIASIVLALPASAYGSPLLGGMVVLLGLGTMFWMLSLRHGKARGWFTDGEVAPGRIHSAAIGDGSVEVSYSYRHDGRAFEGHLSVSDAFVARTVTPDTRVLVFFDPARPEDHVALLAPELEPRERLRARPDI